MKVKNFIAPTMTDAMAQVRVELGIDAVILSSQNVDGGVLLTAAVDETADFDFTPADEIKPLDTRAFFDDTVLRQALDYHTVIEPVAGRLLALCREAGRGQKLVDDRKTLAAGLGRMFKFRPLFAGGSAFKMFMGTPGSGKSTAIAKLATCAKLKGIKTAVVSTDNSKAGANQQLKAFADILEVDFHFFKDPKALFKFAGSARGQYGLVLIDTPGINPFVSAEVEKVAPFAEVVKADKILTMDAGRNVAEAVEGAEIFRDLGADCLLPTRLDLTRRIGAVLSVAACCDLTLGAAGVSSSIASGLAEVAPDSLARLILA